MKTEKELTDLENQKVKNTIKKFARVLNFAFPNTTDVYKGFYCLLTSQAFIDRYFDEECKDKKEFNEMRACLHKVLNQYAQKVFAISYKEGGQNE